MSDDNSQEVKEPLTFADGLQHYFAVRNELYEAKARGDTSEMTTVLEEFFDALRVSLLEAADKAGVADTLRSALYDEQRLERLALWFRKTANNLKATKPGILSLELLGSAGVVVIVVYYVLRVDAWMALLLGFLIIALRLLSPWVVDRIAMHQEKVLRTLRKIDPPQTELRSLYAMPRDFFDPTPEEQNVVLIAAATLREAERLIESCEHCNPDGEEIPFDNILDRVTRSDPSVTDYVLEQPAKCPNCRREILEKTLVEPA